MPLSGISRLLAPELQSLNETIIRCLESRIEVINNIGHYLIESGGKRIRPLVVLLISKACQAKNDDPITMAAIIEFIHTATLLHDDVVDGSKLRRGRPTANRVWDGTTAILAGDFLYSRAFQMVVSLNSMKSMQILADATNVIAEGEVLQLTHRHQPDVNEAQYLDVIHFKTAKLFEAAAQLGAVISHQNNPIIEAMGTYGLHLGMAFQIMDDVLDYRATNESWGKNIGNDLLEGKATLPLIYAMKKAEPAIASQIRQAIIDGQLDDLDIIQNAITNTGAIEYSLGIAEKEIQTAKEALSILPPSPYRDALQDLAIFAVTRGN